MEQKSKGAKSLSNLLSKTAGLVFFSFLAISLGVVFGLLFEGWVKDQPGTPVGSDNTLQTVDLPSDKTSSTTENVKIIDETLTQTPLNQTTTKKPADLASQRPAETGVKPVAVVKYKVRVGPYASQNEALAASQQLHSLGYPVYVANKPPFAVQVGAFATQSNAERLKNELMTKGYKVTVDQN
ncbi:MAG: SPOR domain-containing protein [Bacillota bacterium]